MDIVTIRIALVVIVIAWKVLTGLVKFGLIAVVVIAAIWFLASGGMG